MAKHGIGSILPFLAAPAALLTGGLLAPALFGGEAATAGLGAADAAAGAGGAAGAGLAGDAGLAAAANAAPITAGLGDAVGTTALGATPLTAGAADAAAGAAAGGVSGLSDITAGALPAANTISGGSLPSATDATAGIGTQAATDLATSGPTFLGSITSDPATVAGVAPTADATAVPTSFGGGPGLEAGPGANWASTSDFSSADSSGGGIGSSIWDFVKKNPGLLASIGGIGASALMNNSLPGAGPVNANANAANAAAATAGTNAGQLMAQANQSLAAPNTGALPPGTLDAINNAASAAKTQIRSRFAAMGLPANSTMEAEALGQIDQQVAAQRVDAANKLATLGVSEAGAATSQGSLALGEQGLASNDLQALMRAQIQKDLNLQNALARFAGAAAGPATATASRPTPTAATDTTDTTQVAA